MTERDSAEPAAPISVTAMCDAAPVVEIGHFTCDEPAVVNPWWVTCEHPDNGDDRRVTVPLVLSLFPGIDLLGRGFEAEGYAVTRGPDLIWGGDVRTFHVPADRFDGVIGGSPCQDFSKLNRDPGDYSLRMLAEFGRVVTEAAPLWWLLENVPQVPDLFIAGYSHQRFDLHATEVGLTQSRLRHFQFGHRLGRVLVLDRPARRAKADQPCVVGTGERRTWRDVCRLQGLPDDFELPGMTKAARYRAVGNGVPVPMACFVARAIKVPVDPIDVPLCLCGCGRRIQGKAKAALAACRKRLERARSVSPRGSIRIEGSRAVTGPGESHIAESHLTDQGLTTAGSSRVTQLEMAAPVLSQNGLLIGRK